MYSSKATEMFSCDFFWPNKTQSYSINYIIIRKVNSTIERHRKLYKDWSLAKVHQRNWGSSTWHSNNQVSHCLDDLFLHFKNLFTSHFSTSKSDNYIILYHESLHQGCSKKINKYVKVAVASYYKSGICTKTTEKTCSLFKE